MTQQERGINVVVTSRSTSCSRKGKYVPSHPGQGRRPTDKAQHQPNTTTLCLRKTPLPTYHETHTIQTPSVVPRRRIQGHDLRVPSPPNPEILGFHPGAKEEGNGDVPQRRLQPGRWHPKCHHRRDRHHRSKTTPGQSPKHCHHRQQPMGIRTWQEGVAHRASAPTPASPTRIFCTYHRTRSHELESPPRPSLVSWTLTCVSKGDYEGRT
jgi:hypothetical protein